MHTTVFRRHARRVTLAAVVVGAVLAGTACGPSEAAPQSSDATVREALEDLVRNGFPGAQVVISGPDGERVVTAGVGDIAGGAPIPDHALVRIGSNTKTFVATVVLQLVAEGTLDLDAPVERYLPGVIGGNGNDGNRITVRQLLQHTSGLPDYLGSGAPTADNQVVQLNPHLESVRWQQYAPEQLVGIAMTMPPQFEPGAKSVYTNTNYVLLGMLIERVTGQPYAAEIDRRIIERLGLRDTYVPADGDTGIRDPHPVGYQENDGKRVDFTALDTSWAGAAGAMVSTGADVNRFFTALLAGELLPAAQLAEMQRTVPFDRMANAGYGLGLMRQSLACGQETWGHGGSIPGFGTRNGVRADGTAVTLIVNQLPTTEEQADMEQHAYETAVCAA
ncbi:serine hydrolase domain-containing protein [Nocardia uniformis]|uniref:serine hydrolase domain-containing protein n=1 Tax=Nocardia uniformis TaxID=53432 RepID=UPI000A97B1BC|nr:serine hydrolase domain-containing protein [Nocardia uniformis]